MNVHEYDILSLLYKQKYTNQRELSNMSGYSLGVVNKCLKELLNNGFLDENFNLTCKSINLIKNNSPKRAVILAAGFGMRMVPINVEVPKGLLEINNEVLIERIIKQLHEAEINEIYVVVGFMKEKYEYLIDKFDVELIVNEDYSCKNNLHSLSLIKNKLSNAYVIPCDIWCKNNPFNKLELYSWYMVTNVLDEESEVKVNRKHELVRINNGELGNKMIGISYLCDDDFNFINSSILKLSSLNEYNDSFWECALYKKNTMITKAKVVDNDCVYEINTYEQLRNIDINSNYLKNDAINIICDVFNVCSTEIKNIVVLKKGMTNRSFLFMCKDKKYIMRIPGEGTDKLLNRKNEADVYDVINGKKISDDLNYINSKSGYKITEYFENARVCDCNNIEDVKKCMKTLRNFHELNLKVDHEFNIFNQIEFYEKLWNGKPSIFKDYKETKNKVLSLKSYIDSHVNKKVLTHIDAVPDNFLFVYKNNNEEIRLIDWEYAGMQDPHVDIAMFCIYSFYNKEQIDNLIDYYFYEGCTRELRLKIYCYISVCGLLWSNWCEYKRSLGVEFGEYSLNQYRYAKEYYRIVKKELNGCE